jgi:DNA-binding NarL/FixJ family response regulator
MTGIKTTPRDREVVNGLLCGLSNREIAEDMKISVSTVKQHIARLMVRAGLDGAGRVKLVAVIDDDVEFEPHPSFTPREMEVARRVCQGVRSREVGMELGMSAQSVKNHLRCIFDKVGVWSRLELRRKLMVKREL